MRLFFYVFSQSHSPSLLPFFLMGTHFPSQTPIPFREVSIPVDSVTLWSFLPLCFCWRTFSPFGPLSPLTVLCKTFSPRPLDRSPRELCLSRAFSPPVPLIPFLVG